MNNTAPTEKRCRICRLSLKLAAFAHDASRGDGLKTICRDCSKDVYRNSYVPRVRTAPPGPSPIAERDGDKRQARRRINVLVSTGKLPRPNDLPCTDCGHVWTSGERRHEYDHHLGYGAGNHLMVQAVCSGCHHERERGRK
jgi:hypothetical protein